jgi:hypothetical protein
MLSNLDDVEVWLKDRFAGVSLKEGQREEALRILGWRPQLKLILESSLNDKTRLEQMAQQSYRHPNSFDKLILIDSKEVGFKLRMHIWRSSDESHHSEHIHNHAWDFSSILLTGAYNFQMFSRSEEGSNMFHYKPAPLSTGEQGHKLVFQGVIKACRIFSGELVAGCCYSIPHTLLHRVVNSRNRVTSTLLLQCPRIPDKWPDILNETEISFGCDVPIKPLDRSELTKIIETYLSELPELI